MSPDSSARPTRETILIVDDSPEALEVLEGHLTGEGYRVVSAPGVVEAVEVLERQPIDLVVTDLKMPQISGLNLVRHVRENYRDVEVMMVTGFPSVETAVEAVKTGAEEFLGKPFTDQELLSAVERVLTKLRARRALERPPPPSRVLPGLLGESIAMQPVLTAIERATTAGSPVLLVGERGVGKEYLARVIHYGGPRAAGPFITARLTGIPPGRMYTELFGCPAQGGRLARPGLLHAAAGGSLYLEEVAEATPDVQEQLGSFLEERQTVQLGGPPDARLFAATHRDLGQLLRNGAFREDLYYSISAVTIAVPPLRQRGDDVLLLARYFLRRIAAEEGRAVPTLSDRAIQALREHAWPGNVRELESTLRRLVVMSASNVVDVPDLPTLMRFQAAREWMEQRSLEEVEAEHIRVVLAAVGGNQTRAAEILGIDRKTLHQKLQRD